MHHGVILGVRNPLHGQHFQALAKGRHVHQDLVLPELLLQGNHGPADGVTLKVDGFTGLYIVVEIVEQLHGAVIGPHGLEPQGIFADQLRIAEIGSFCRLTTRTTRTAGLSTGAAGTTGTWLRNIAEICCNLIKIKTFDFRHISFLLIVKAGWDGTIIPENWAIVNKVQTGDNGDSHRNRGK